MVCLVIVVPVTRNYIKQYNELKDLRIQIAEQQAKNDALRNKISRWDDDSYVIAQARERLTFVFPGETPYKIMGWDGGDSGPTTTDEDPALFPDQEVPWYDFMWQSIEKAGNLGAADVGRSGGAAKSDGAGASEEKSAGTPAETPAGQSDEKPSEKSAG